MRIPMKVDYGVRALVDLAQHSDGRPVRTAEIAARQPDAETFTGMREPKTGSRVFYIPWEIQR
jgi:hypothetical protein